MKIGILSDTHDHLERLAAAIRLLNARDAELVLHLGDWVAPFVPLFLTKTAPEPLRCPVKDLRQQRWRPLPLPAGERAAANGRRDRRTILPLVVEGAAWLLPRHRQITAALVASKGRRVFTGTRTNR